MWRVVLHPEADRELGELALPERVAIVNAIEKLQALGPALSFPHQSDVRSADDLRELRPRAGRSAWRGFYRRVGDTFTIAAVGPEAAADPRGFERTVRVTVTRLDEIELEGGAT